jgi:hypothetical protein
MVALVIALNILLCKFIDAFIQTDTNVADLIRVANIIENVKTAKTMIHVCLEIVHPNKILDTSSVVEVLLSVDVNVLLSIFVNILLSTLFT